MDAQNAINSINRTSLILNICVLWPRASRYVFNTYRGSSSLIVRDSKSIIFSCEGVIQGDPPSMFMYAIGTVPLVQQLESPSLWWQLWYADDASVLGDTHSFKVWLDKLMEIGPLFGYIPEPTKSTLIVKESSPGCPPNSPFRAQV